MLVDFIAGARPNFMKIASIVRAIDSRKIEGGKLCYRLVHTGQHYDPLLSGVFFEQLEIRQPDFTLETGKNGGTHYHESL